VNRIFPLPAVGLPDKPSSDSRRLQAVYRTACKVTDLANHSRSALNELSFSFVKVKGTMSKLASSHVTSSQTRLLAHVYTSASRYLCRRTSGIDQSSLHYNISLNPQESLATQGYSKTISAVPIFADRISLPSEAGQVDMLTYLPHQWLNYYSNESNCLRPTQDMVQFNDNPLPKPKFMGIRSEYIKLLDLLYGNTMISYTTQQPLVVNGLFGTPKGDKIRLIIDGRPSNRVFADPPHVELSGPDRLSRLTVSSTKVPLYVAKCDLSDFFYRFRTPLWMHKYFGMPSIMSQEVPHLLSLHGPGVRIWPQLTVLAMGWSHSVFITQMIHEHILDTRTSLVSANRINSINDLHINRMRHLVYIDDLIILSHDKDEVNQAQQQYVNQVNSINLPVKPSKVSPPSATGVECLGVDINGTDYTVGVSPDKLHKLCIDTRQLLINGKATGRYLAQIVGRWTWAMLVCRPALACFNSVYRFIQLANRNLFNIWPSVHQELWCAIRLAPLLWSSLDGIWFDRVLACDASLDGQGVCATKDIPTDSIIKASYHCGVIVNSDPVNQSSINTSLGLLPMTGTHHWSTIVSSPWTKGEEHINSYELRSATTAIRWTLSFPQSLPHRRLLLLSDSQVAVGCLTKGRSSSHNLLKRLRTISSLLLASGLQLFCRWIPSESNPADEPSRRFSIYNDG
jgi:hypothetical protein